VALALATLAVLGLAVGPLLLPYKLFTVMSRSMEPSIPLGAEVLDISVPGRTLKEGDVITFDHPERPDERVTHRIVAVDRSAAAPVLTTKGDANGVADPWRLTAAGPTLKVVAAVPYAGFALSGVGSPTARLLLVGLVVIAAISYLFEFWRSGHLRRDA
jgi:signal peptidase